MDMEEGILALDIDFLSDKDIDNLFDIYCVPHTRGDEPRLLHTHIRGLSCSPHAWG